MVIPRIFNHLYPGHVFFRARLLPFYLAIALFCGPPLIGGEAPPSPEENPTAEASKSKRKPASKQAVINERVQVIGSQELAERMPGSAHYIDKKQLEEQGYADIHRILRQVPGINIQEEEGLGLRPNIGIRGTGVERSQKITLMEDGVLIAPAPYTAPAAYYFPTAARMESFEILKGASAIKQGPYTNGGTLNMISTSLPGDFSAHINAAGGSHDTRKFDTSIGNATARTAWLVETFQLASDGFKDLDGGGDTGVELEDYMAKFRLNSGADAGIFQMLEIKAGKTTQFGNETYLGLTEQDFRQTPYRRYASSALDFIDTDHEQLQLRHFIQPSENMDITTTVYNNDYFRNWHKLEKVNGISNARVLDRPDDFPTELRILRGEIDSAAGSLTIRNNRRNYYSRGIQSVLHWNLAAGGAEHQLELGIRYHEDEEDRFQDEERYQMQEGALQLSETGAPGSQANRVSNAEALSFFIQDTLAYGSWTFKPGLRFESIDYVREDYATSDPDRAQSPTRIRENSLEVFLPGLGVDYALSSSDRVFAGVYRGFSPPGAGKNPGTEEEKSTNYEFGYRHGKQNFRAEVIGFFNDYSNLLGMETVSGGGLEEGALFNGGAVEVSGLEASLHFDLSQAAESSLSFPLSLSYTYTDSEFQSSFETSFADWSPSVAAGDSLPSIPANQLTMAIGARKGRWGIHLLANHVSEMRTKAGQGPIPQDEKIESRTVFDLTGDVQPLGKLKLYARVRNLTDEEYIVARRPYGVRPGLERSFLLGISAHF